MASEEKMRKKIIEELQSLIIVTPQNNGGYFVDIGEGAIVFTINPSFKESDVYKT